MVTADRVLQVVQPLEHAGAPAHLVEQLLGRVQGEEAADDPGHPFPVFRQPALDLLEQVEDVVAHHPAGDAGERFEKKQQFLRHLPVDQGVEAAARRLVGQVEPVRQGQGADADEVRVDAAERRRAVQGVPA